MTVLSSDQDTVLVETPKTLTVVSENVLSQVVEKPESVVVSLVENTTLYHTTSSIEEVVAGGIQGPPGIPGTSTQFEYVVAGQVLGGNRAVTTNLQGQLVYPDPASTTSRVYGLTMHSALQGELVTVQIAGTQTEPSWSWDVTKPVFVGLNGVLTQTVPITGQTLVVGYPNSPTKLFIDRQPPIYMG